MLCYGKSAIWSALFNTKEMDCGLNLPFADVQIVAVLSIEPWWLNWHRCNPKYNTVTIKKEKVWKKNPA